MSTNLRPTDKGDAVVLHLTTPCLVCSPATANYDTVCLQVHAEDEMEHAAIGHEAVRSFVPAELAPVVKRAMLDHDRDFASFYNAMATLLEQHCR